jgi:hypothetical protein
MELSIEEQIADAYVAPAPEKRICQWEPRPGYPACTTSLAQSNRESLCFRHTQLERTLKTIQQFSRSNEDALEEFAPRKELRLCAVMDCNRKLLDKNTTGRCTGHWYLKQGMQMKDGSISRPVPIAPLPPIEPLAPIQPLEPIAAEKKEERTPVTEENVVQTCAAKGCDVVLMHTNKSGRCTNHFYVKRGQEMKDGSIPRPESAPQPRPTAPKEPKKCAVMNCHTALAVHNRTGRCDRHYNLQRGMQLKDGSIPKPHSPLSLRMRQTRDRNSAAGQPEAQAQSMGFASGMISATSAFVVGERAEEFPPPGMFMPLTLPDTPEPRGVPTVDVHVSLKVPIEAIDRFLLNMSMEDKTRIVEREIFGGQ